jgi:DNA-directed RNA polymerase subunit RPC12/RpoP
MRAISVQIRTSCTACGSPLPLNAMVPRLACPSCSTPNDLNDDFWRNVLGDEGLSSATIILQGREVALEVDYRDEPACAACGTAIPLDAARAAADEGGVGCPGCGVRALVRVPPPAWAASGFPLLVGEDPLQVPAAGGTVEAPESAARPVAFNCATCGGVLQVDGTARVVQCGYCAGSAYLPDALWHVFHPVPVTRRWFLVHDPRARRQARREAQDAATAPARLGELSVHLDDEVREAVARHPRAPEAALRRLAAADDSLAGDALENPALPRPMWAELAASGRSWLLAKIARSPNATPDALRIAADRVADRLSDDWGGDEDEFDDSEIGDVLEGLAENPGSSPEILLEVWRLNQQRDEDDRGDYGEALAKHAATPAALLAELARSEDDSVREAVAAHPGTQPEVLEALAGDGEWSVREVVAKRTELSAGTLKRLGKDENYDVREVARANASYPRFSLWKALFGG